MDTPKQWIDAGAWIGRQQAFAVIGSKCAAAQALALKQIKESRSFEELDLSWEEFCPKYAGVSRAHADHLIGRYDEFGANYFKLSEIARISPEVYRQIEPQVEGETIEIGGRKLAFTPENAPAIRQAVNQLRADLRTAQTRPADSRDVREYRITVDALVEEVSRKLKPALDACGRTSLSGLIEYSIEKFTRMRKTLAELPEVPYYNPNRRAPKA
jgi:hypothetical protein